MGFKPRVQLRALPPDAGLPPYKPNLHERVGALEKRMDELTNALPPICGWCGRMGCDH